MKAELKFLQSYDVPQGLENYVPNGNETMESFNLLVHLDIGPRAFEGDGSNIFHLYICTPDQVESNCKHGFFVWGKHTLIVKEYDYFKIRQIIEKTISEVTGDSWHSIAIQLSRFFGWEFENHQPNIEEKKTSIWKNWF